MAELRASEWTDVPRLKELWKLAFGDEDAYIDHFFTHYYAPERMLVLEETGIVQAMTAWFDMPVVFADGTTWPCAYLYAVATHPDRRGKGLAGQLLAFADRWLKERGFACVSTVPARADLHVFFGRNGFKECFTLQQQEYRPQPGTQPAPLEPVSAQQYSVLRERALTGTDHIAYAAQALEYQAGVCALSGGGMYQVAAHGCACVEVAGDKVYVKELLTQPQEREAALAAIAKAHPARQYWVRSPHTGQAERWEFAMLKWLIPQPKWNKKTAPYLGLAFD